MILSTALRHPQDIAWDLSVTVKLLSAVSCNITPLCLHRVSWQHGRNTVRSADHAQLHHVTHLLRHSGALALCTACIRVHYAAAHQP